MSSKSGKAQFRNIVVFPRKMVFALPGRPEDHKRLPKKHAKIALKKKKEHGAQNVPKWVSRGTQK